MYSAERPRLAVLPAPNHIPPRSIISPIPPMSPVTMGLGRPPWIPMAGMGPMNAGMGPMNGRMGPLNGMPLVASHMGFPLMNRPPMFSLGRPVLPTSLHQGLPTSLHQGLPTSLQQGFMPPPPFLPAAVLSHLRPPLMPPGMGPPSPQPATTPQTLSIQHNIAQVSFNYNSLIFSFLIIIQCVPQKSSEYF